MDNKLLSEYHGVVTSDGRIVDGSVRNVFDLASGLVINELGTRESTEKFYREEYSLHEESADSEIADYENKVILGISEVVTDFILGSWKGSERCKIVDVGCGKGLLLRSFRQKFPNAELTGVEPSERARVMLADDPSLEGIRVLSADEIFQTGEKFDLLIINGVLEHVEDPKLFLHDLKSIVSEKGNLFVGVPNFLSNPLDLFTHDHLTRFTPKSLSKLFNSVGLKPIASQVNETRVAMWWLCKHGNNFESSKSIFADEDELALVEKNQNWLDRCLKEIPAQIKEAKSFGKPVVIYGTANLWPALLAQGFCSLSEVDHIIDDNETYWGSEKWEGRIESPEKVLSQKGFEPLVVISANPCYNERISERVNLLSEGKADVLMVSL